MQEQAGMWLLGQSSLELEQELHSLKVLESCRLSEVQDMW